MKKQMANGKWQMANFSLRKGFTVIELALYMGLLAVFLTVLSQLFVASLDVQLESESTSSVEQDGKFLLSRLSYDVTRSSSISEPTALATQSSRLQLVAGGISYRYELTGSNLTLTDNLGTDQLNSVNTRVSNLLFERRGNLNGKPTITVSFLVTSTIQRKNGPESKTFKTTIGTR